MISSAQQYSCPVGKDRIFITRQQHRPDRLCIILWLVMIEAHQNHCQSCDRGKGLACLGMSDDGADEKTNGLGSQQTQQDRGPVCKEGTCTVPARQQVHGVGKGGSWVARRTAAILSCVHLRSRTSQLQLGMHVCRSLHALDAQSPLQLHFVWCLQRETSCIRTHVIKKVR